MVASLLLAPWPIAYAYGSDAGNTAGQAPVTVAAAAPEATPKINAFGNAIGGITPGDLFYIDTSNSPADTPVTLHITNSNEIASCYRYLTLKVGVYVKTGTGRWGKATLADGEILPDTYITMLNGMVSFTLPGNAEYKITIDKGCFYCYGTVTGASAAAPTFYLTVG